MYSCDLTDLSAEASAIQRLTPEQRDRLTSVLDRYLSALEQGAPLAWDELLATHADLAVPLQAYLAGLDKLHSATAQFARASDRAEPEDLLPASDEKRVGDFRLLREIGRGGMGVVYEAQQISLGRRVAMKVLPFAAVLDPRQIDRFKHEAQAAAQLDHPNIVSVFAVGMDRGIHYYAMRLIDGQPLDRALTELRMAAGAGPTGAASDTAVAAPLADAQAAEGVCPSTGHSFLTAKSSNRQAYFRTVLQLGIQAAEALHAAHEFGIIHRDVKPSNLLLDADGKLWVTDFGLARCRTDVSLTRTGDVIGTARYMSPEQASGQSALVDQRADIYSLGVTLYEMLALRPAFPGDDCQALFRRIEQEEPTRLRLLQPQISADMETVVLKAMAKRREDRYTTARDFADDMQRVLDGRPTVAKPPTILDRLAKWARRHQRAVAVAAAVCLFAVVGMAASTLLILREKVKAEENYACSERHFREAQEVVHTLGVQLAEQLAGVPGAERVRRDLLQKTLRYYCDFVDQARNNPTLRADMALTYCKIGALSDEMGANHESIAAHENAIRLFTQLATENPRERDYRRRLAVSQSNMALVLSRSGRTDAARHAYGEAIRLQDELVRDGKEAAHLSDLALSHNNLGLLQNETSDSVNAEASFREAIRLQEQLLDIEPGSAEYLRNLAASYNNLGAIYIGSRPNQAVDLYQKALECQKKAAAAKPRELKYRNEMARTYNNLGAAQSRLGRFAEAAAAYQRAIEFLRELVLAAPAQKSCRDVLAVSFNNLGLTQNNLHRATDAECSFRKSLDLEETLVSQSPHDVDLQSSLGGVYNNLGSVLEERQRLAEAAECYKQAVKHQQIACSQAPQVSRYREFLSKHYYNYGRTLRCLGRPDEAARIALARRTLWPKEPGHLFTIAQELALAAKALTGSQSGDMTAQQCADSAIETLQQAAAAGWKPSANADWTEPFAVLKERPGFAKFTTK